MTTKPTFTCASCHAVFDTADLHRSHYQTDWHRYNLRRKVSELPPVVEPVFLKRLGQLTNTEIRDESIGYDCSTCAKSFSSENSYLNHVNSKRHRENLNNPKQQGATLVRNKAANPIGEEGYIDENATEEEIRRAIETKLSTSRRLRMEDCIFCNLGFEDFDHNMEHMAKEHSLYIPDLEFVSDLSGLIAYLSDKVSIAHCCLYCSAIVQPFTSLESVRRHMIDKGHLKVRFDDEGMEELVEFYDYEPIMSDDGNDDFVDVNGTEEPIEEEYDDSVLVISPDETELILPSGKRLGHRAYRRYYNQNLRVGAYNRPTRRNEHHQALIERISDHYLATGMATMKEQQKYMVDQRKSSALRNKWDMKIGEKANNLQEYFRYQLRQ